MKKIAISLLALAALSTASFASYRDVTTPRGAVDTRQVGTVTSTDAIAIPNSYNGNAASNGSGAGDDLGLGGSNRR